MKAYLSGMKDIDVNKIEESMRPEVSEFLINMRNEYNRAAECASKEDAGDGSYLDCVSTMNRVNSAITNLNENLSYFKMYRDGYLEDFENNRISKQPGSNTDFLNAMFKNNIFDIEIADDGTVDLMQDGEIIKMMDIDKNPLYNYHLKNAEGINTIMSLNNQAANLGRKFLNSDKAAYGLALDNYLNGIERADLLSLVYDDDIQKGTSLFNVNMGTNVVTAQGVEIPFIELVNNPEYEDELRRWLKQKYLSVFTGTASEGFTASKDAWKQDYTEKLGEKYVLINRDLSKMSKKAKDELLERLILDKENTLSPPGTE